MGVWLVLIPLLLAPFAFRKGWASALALPLALAVGFVAPAAEAWTTDWWLRSDQQAARAFEAGDHARAAELFESEPWRGAARYRAGDYAGAVESLSASNDPQSHYNLGNALAHSQQLEQAIAAYDRVLEAEPDHVDALHNRQVVEKLLKQQQKEKQEREQQDSQDPSQQSESQDGRQPQESQQAQDESQGQDPQAGQEGEGSPEHPSEQASGDAEEPKSASDPAQDQAPAEAEHASDGAEEQNAQGEAAEEEGQPGPREQARAQPPGSDSADGEPQGDAQTGSASPREYSERDQEMEQRLNRVPDDPGGLLREKLRRRHLERRYGMKGGMR